MRRRVALTTSGNEGILPLGQGGWATTPGFRNSSLLAAERMNNQTSMATASSRLMPDDEGSVGERLAGNAIACGRVDRRDAVGLDTLLATVEALRASERRSLTLLASLPGGAALVIDHEPRYQVADGEALRAADLRLSDLTAGGRFGRSGSRRDPRDAPKGDERGRRDETAVLPVFVGRSVMKFSSR